MAILPYYIASLNIEYTYRERTGRYLEFPNLCFVDTLDNMDWQKAGATGGAVTRQSAFNLGAVSTENWMRVQLQNEKTISVIMGNPPYNANQQNENDNNKNREYPEIDRRIRDTYIKASTAQKTKQYDMYKRFIRWASDRLADDGIIAFITNRAYIDARQDDGFRKIATEDFSDLYIIDLGGDIRAKRRVGNVFGIMTGVAIGFFVRTSSSNKKGRVHYHALVDGHSGSEKLAELKALSLASITFNQIAPDVKHNWLNQADSNFSSLLSLANRQTKLAKNTTQEQAVFRLYSMGVISNRDDWAWDSSRTALSKKIREFSRIYQAELERFAIDNPDRNTIGDWVDRSIKWTSELEDHLAKGDRIIFRPRRIVSAFFRPFVLKYCYYAPIVTHRRYQMPQLFPHDARELNRLICFSVNRGDFHALASNRVVDLHFTGDTQCLPLYRYTADGERVSNITAWGLKQINDHYRKEWGKDFDKLCPGGSITAEQIFAYTYAVLHDPVYRHDYAIDLLREFPRLPLYHDFDTWARMGQQLLDLHIGFETVEPYALKRLNTAPKRARDSAPRTILRADKARGAIVLDDETTLTGVPPDAWRYRLGSRSALEWVLDQYKERKPRDPTIAAKFDTYRFADHKERVIDLLRRVCTVSVQTMEIVDGMAYWEGEDLIVFGDRGKHELATLSLSQ